MPALAAGRIRHRVTFQRFVALLDSNGEEVQDPNTGVISKEWQDVATIWCAIEPLSGREFIASQAVQSKVTGKFIARKRTDIDAACRAIHNGTYYQVEAVLPDPESGLEYMTMPFSQGVNDGQ
jgi:SPP1 family predicted phage head-tail adaptor